MAQNRALIVATQNENSRRRAIPPRAAFWANRIMTDEGPHVNDFDCIAQKPEEQGGEN